MSLVKKIANVIADNVHGLLLDDSIHDFRTSCGQAVEQTSPGFRYVTKKKRELTTHNGSLVTCRKCHKALR